MRKILSGIVLAGVAALSVGGTEQPAAATTCTPVVLSARVPNVTITATGRAAVLVSVRAQDACSTSPFSSPGIFGVSVTAVNPASDVATAFLSLTGGTSTDGMWTGALAFDRRSNVGTWTVDVTATDGDQPVTNVRQASFKLRRNTLINVNASPKRARRGHAVKVSGHLARLTLGLKYIDWRRQVVRIYFQQSGRRTRTFMGNTRTDRTGHFKRSFLAKRTGRWFAYEPGNATNTNRLSSGVLVRVR